jgi:AmmeMemoRadiSam system protein A
MSVTLSQNLSQKEMIQLWQVAHDAICGLFSEKAVSPPQLDVYPEKLTRPGACFVTLEVNGQLHGCLGTLVAHSPLVLDVYDKARASATQDRRFLPLIDTQLDALSIEVSVLSEPEPLEMDTESALLASDQMHQGVFLPQVWESLPKPEDFLRHLKLKAGWHENYWSSEIEVKVFTVTSIKRDYQ